jgi:hypothetical protein
MVYILGGTDPTNASKDVYIYSVAEDQWFNQRVDFNLNTWFGNEYPKSVAMNGQFYAMRSYLTFGQLMEFSATEWQLKDCPPLSFDSDYPPLIHTAGNGKVLAMVHEPATGMNLPMTRFFAFDVSDRFWKDLDPLPHSRPIRYLEIIGKRVIAIDEEAGLEWIDFD